MSPVVNVRSPCDGAPIGELSALSEQEVEQALARAHSQLTPIGWRSPGPRVVPFPRAGNSPSS